ncbi:MAG: MOSC domain-containing protein [Flavicella sp.]
MKRIVSTNRGDRKEIEWKGITMTTGIFKYPVPSLSLGLEEPLGDAVIDRRYHGGRDKAVYAYSLDHYEFWKERYPNLDWNFGMFGENLTVAGLDEQYLHIGSRYKVGTAILEVSGPRQPCVKLGMRFNDSKMVKSFLNTTMCGVYFRVLKTGEVKPNDTFTLLEENSKGMSIATAYLSKKKKA